MFHIKIANLTIKVNNHFDYVHWLCQDYIVAPTDSPDMIIDVSKEEVRKELEKSDLSTTPAYVESICVYRSICKQLPERFQGFLMHCAVIEYKGRGYAFAAKSGTGKSTHILLWQKKFGDSVHVINGDKPIMRFGDDGTLYAYGTPWCGKEGLNTNTSVPLQAICFLERAQTNSIIRIDASEAIKRIFHQLLSAEDLQGLDALFSLLDQTLRTIPCYVLGCNISEEAAEIAYEGMKS